MKNFSKYLALFVAAISIVALANAAPIRQANPQESIVEGSLVQLDSTAKLLTLRAADKDIQFSFNDQTQVIGPEKDGKPVAVRQGSKLKIFYKAGEVNNMATRIEVTEP